MYSIFNVIFLIWSVSRFSGKCMTSVKQEIRVVVCLQLPSFLVPSKQFEMVLLSDKISFICLKVMFIACSLKQALKH
jgi:RNase P subunit RPR2